MAGFESSDERHFAIPATISALGLVQLATAAYMLLAPRSFHREIGAYGFANPHYVRDLASFSAALGIALLIAARNASWRVPVLVVTALQTGLHLANHVADADNGLREATGWSNLAMLGAGLAVVLWLLFATRRASIADVRPPR